MSAWKDGSPSAFAHPDVNTMRVTAHGRAAPTAASAVSVPARMVCTVVVARRMRRRGIRSARAPPSGPVSALGRNPAAATIPAQPA